MKKVKLILQQRLLGFGSDIQLIPLASVEGKRFLLAFKRSITSDNHSASLTDKEVGPWWWWWAGVLWNRIEEHQEPTRGLK